MAKRQIDPYEQFLRTHRLLAIAADQVLEGIGEFSALRTPDDFRQAAARLKTDRDTAQADTSVRELLERHLRPDKPDANALRRLSLVGRAVEVASGHSLWHHQIVCALLLNRGVIVEMPNGAGKTLAIAVAAASSLGASTTHIVTSNDYLAERDARWMAGLYHLLGLRVGVVFSSQSPYFKCGVIEPDGRTLRVAPETPASPFPPAEEAGLTHETTGAYETDPALTLQRVLESDVVYGRVEAFAFAYLNDNLATTASAQVLTRRDALVIDECDTVLLDDLRLPMIINRPRVTRVSAGDLSHLYLLALSLVRDRDFTVSGKQVRLTFEGLAEAERLLGVNIFTPEHGQLAVGLQNALTAIHAYAREVDYVVEHDRITLIDDSSGRLLHGRRYSGGLHEAIEVKEGLPVRDLVEMEPIAKIAIKHLVKTYLTVAGTSGSVGVAEEYSHFYQLQVVHVEPYTLSRRDHPDLVFKTRREAIQYGIVPAALEASHRGQPVLINVPTLKDVEAVATLLASSGAPFQALDANTIRTLGDEAEKTRRAGSQSLITICSKVAARGTDIVLDAGARAAGGLFVIGLERGTDRRYDDQLRGRAGRHGDPGDSLFVLSLEDEFLRRFGASYIAGLMDEGVPTEHRMVTRSIARAQRVAERNSHKLRLKVIELDDILDRHRLVVYRVRQKVLVKDDLLPEVTTMVENWISIQFRRADDDPLQGRIVEQLARAEIGRISNVRNRKTQARMLRESLQRQLTSTMAGTSAGLRETILAALDAEWRSYLAFEDAARTEMSLYSWDDPNPWARYAQRMEERFDTFFHDVGEQVLFNVLAWPTIPSLMAANLPAVHG